MTPEEIAAKFAEQDNRLATLDGAIDRLTNELATLNIALEPINNGVAANVESIRKIEADLAMINDPEGGTVARLAAEFATFSGNTAQALDELRNASAEGYSNSAWADTVLQKYYQHDKPVAE